MSVSENELMTPLSGGNGAGGKDSAPPAEVVAARRRATWPLALVAFIFILVPFLFWYGTWFGRSLSDADIERYLNEDTNPRHIQHALSQIADRIGGGDTGVVKWYGRIVALAANPHADVRMTAAWVMGQDNRVEEFHQTLLRLLNDDEPIVRRNAALALVRFNDARSRAELRAMLNPFSVVAPFDGEIITALPEGAAIKREELLARIRGADNQARELRSPLPGKIIARRFAANSSVSAGAELFSLAPDTATVWEALRALYLIGGREDLPEVQRYAMGGEDVSERIREQAVRAAREIERRTAQPSP